MIRKKFYDPGKSTVALRLAHPERHKGLIEVVPPLVAAWLLALHWLDGEHVELGAILIMLTHSSV